jgi:hypothetical protein
MFIPLPWVSNNCRFGAVTELALILVTFIFGFKLTMSFKRLILFPALKVSIVLITLLLMFIPLPWVSNNCRFGAVMDVPVSVVIVAFVALKLIELKLSISPIGASISDVFKIDVFILPAL